ncbi:MAG: hypothetical protein ACK45B_15865 [Limisphaerales bacterium]
MKGEGGGLVGVAADGAVRAPVARSADVLIHSRVAGRGATAPETNAYLPTGENV